MKSRIVLLITAIWLGCLSSAMGIVQWPLTVTNIAELQSLSIAFAQSAEGITNSVAPVVFVLGYYTPGDRGGGTFEWDPNSAGIPDGGRYITTNGWSSGNGRWVRRLNGEVANVKMWGAKGDIPNTTPSGVAAGHDDFISIQSAFDACPGDGWTSEILIPSGWYKITNTLIFHQMLKIRGDNARMSHLVMPLGVSKDILHSVNADAAIISNDATLRYDENIRIEDLSFDFATQSGNYFTQSSHNGTNAAIVICQPEEGSTIRNISTAAGGYGIRCFGGGGGAPAAFRDVVCSGAAIAGICIEPIPGGNEAGGQVSITGITGDHTWDDSRSNACLVKFLNYAGSAVIEDVNAEGEYGGGIIQSQFPASVGASELGILNVHNCLYQYGSSFGGFAGPNDFLVLKSAGYRTTAVLMENIQVSGGNMIRDEATGRNVGGLDASGNGLNQSICRIPVQYEGWNYHANRGDGTLMAWTRLVVGGQTLYNFVPTTNGWYRIIEPVNGGYKAGGKITVTSANESSEFNFDILTTGGSDAAMINVVRSTHDSVTIPPCATQARAGVYLAPDGYGYGFVDIHVEHLLPGDSDPYVRQITIGYPVYDVQNVELSSGMSPLQNPTAPVSSIVPTSCTLLQCVTNSLVR